MIRIFSSTNVKKVDSDTEHQIKEHLVSQEMEDLAQMSTLIRLKMHLKVLLGLVRQIMDLFLKMIVEMKEEDALSTEKLI